MKAKTIIYREMRKCGFNPRLKTNKLTYVFSFRNDKGEYGWEFYTMGENSGKYTLGKSVCFTYKNKIIYKKGGN